MLLPSVPTPRLDHFEILRSFQLVPAGGRRRGGKTLGKSRGAVSPGSSAFTTQGYLGTRVQVFGL